MAREWETIKKVNGLREEKGRRVASRPMAGGGRGGSAGVSILFNFVRTMLRAGSSLTGGILQVQKGDLKT